MGRYAWVGARIAALPRRGSGAPAGVFNCQNARGAEAGSAA